ncbi:MAG: carboxylesterase/lipase family protein [Deltaproteobacteria bacterium]|nr:carboxylesterase/lipase family protein [Deltaproteobacteria bacterium]
MSDLIQTTLRNGSFHNVFEGGFFQTSTKAFVFVLACSMLWSCASSVEKPDLSIPENLPRIEAVTPLGTVRGLQEDNVFAFYGVPYAAPFDGLDRFLPPKPAASYTGILDATKYGPACKQLEQVMPSWMLTNKMKRYTTYAGMEDIAAQEKGPDCLNLNLWTSSLNAETTNTAPVMAPVMVFLHGGGLNQGSNRSAYFHGANLAKKGVVVVNINFRLGIQGFMGGHTQFDGEVLLPNRGLMDMVMALRWLRDNIAAFGGDPGRVTLVGESGGAFAVWGLLSSPSTDGLIHRAIVQSAPPLMTPAADLEAVSVDMLKDLGIEPGDTEALAAIPDDDIPHTALSQKLMSGDEYGFLSRNNLPYNGAYGTVFIPEDTIPAFAAGRSSKVDVLIGVNKHEARGLAIMVPLPDLMSVQITGNFLGGMIAVDDENKERVLVAYKTKLLPDASELEIEEQLVQDAAFRQPMIRAAEARLKHGGEGRTFMYEFHWESPCCDGEIGAIHAMEVAFAYDNLDAAKMLTDDDPSAQPLATAMSDAWVSFAKTGVPSSTGLPQWPTYDEQTRQTMILDRKSRVVSDPDQERRLFWDKEYANRK